MLPPQGRGCQSLSKFGVRGFEFGEK